MKLIDLKGWQLLAPGTCRCRTLILMLFALCSQAWALREIPIDLPTTVIGYDERGGRRVICGRSIMVSDSGDSYRAPVEMPFLTDGNLKYAQAVKLSIDGNYVFVVGGPDGLYRYDISNRTWKTIRPVGARASFPAIAVGPDGTLYAGIGSQYFDASYTGLYRSTDNGENWTEMELILDSVRVSPSIRDFLISGAGRIFIKGRLTSTDGGTWYEVLSDGTVKRLGWLRILVHNEMVSLFDTDYIRFGRKPGDTSKPRRYLFSGDTLIKTAVAWPDSDTILAMVEHGGRYTALLFYDGTIVRSFDLGTSNDDFRPWIASSYDGGRRCILFFGLGRNDRIYLDNGKVVPLDIPTQYPIVLKVLCTRDWGLARVFRHGWFRFDSSGTTRFDSAVSKQDILSGWLNASKLSRRLFIADYGRRVREITEFDVDTIVTLPTVEFVNSADLIDGSSDLYWAIDQRVFKTNLATNATDTLALNGWPFTGMDTLRQPFSVSGVMVFGRRILAWASSTSTTTQDQANEGLYEYADSAWKFVRGSTDGRRTRMIASGRNDSTVVFSIAEDLGRLGYSAPSIVMMHLADTVASLCPTADIFLSEVTSLTTFGASALFTASTDKLYRVAPEAPPVELDLGTKVFAAVEMDRYVAISSGSRGVFLLPKSDLVTNVQDDSPVSRGAGQAEAYPNPVEQDQPLTLSLPQCCRQPSITWVDLLGREAFSGGFDREASQEGNRYRVTARVPAGHYLLRVSGPACMHVVPVLVRR
ncbi:MAG: hypothetical protein FGM33_08270 [Candidatus Kapabacteria bacterium]|nr:hypothetical protein [Candidatus Kapabacteria bacterium]